MARATVLSTCLLLLAAVTAEAGEPIEIEIWCPDANRDGTVDNTDVLIVGAAHGCTEQGCSAWDANHNGIVGENDLAKTQAMLGPCPDRCDTNADGALTIADLLTVLDGQSDPDLNCRADLDHSRTIDGVDMYIFFSSLGGSPDALPDTLVDENGPPKVDDPLDVVDDDEISGADSSAINLQQGAWCGGDVNGDGEVDDADYQVVCWRLGYSETECGGRPQLDCAGQLIDPR